MNLPNFAVGINPPGTADEYLRCLNECFARWGDRRTYDWYFDRRSTGYSPDRIVLYDRGRMTAGVGVTYRMVACPNRSAVRAGILTGAWTLPETRGRGCFGQLIQEGIRLCKQHSCAVLLSFVTADNASCRQLGKAGAEFIPGYYLFSTPETPRREGGMPLTTVSATPRLIGEARECLERDNSQHVAFVYPSPAEFAAQFMERPLPTEAVQGDEGSLGFIELTDDTVRLQLLLPESDTQTGWERNIAAYLEFAAARSRNLFLYATRDFVRDVCLSKGMNVKPGYLMSLAVDAVAYAASGLSQGIWNVQSGERA